MVIDVDKSKKPVTNACYDICNRFYTKRANGIKITSFRGVPFFDALVREEPLHPGARNFVTKKLESLWQPTIKILWF